MSDNPGKRGTPHGPPQVEATGEFTHESLTSADAAEGKPAPSATFEATCDLPPVGAPAIDATLDVPAAGAPAIDATGMYEAAPPRGAAPAPGEATEATGMFVPPAAAPIDATADGATGVFVTRQGPAVPESAVATLDPGAAGAPGKPPPPAPSADRRCGHYVLKRFHAKGGMGEIWLAEDPDIGRSVALKRMLGKRADARARFVVEAQITGQLEHPGIVPVHELGKTPDGQPWYVMKFVHGQTLKKVIQTYHESLKTGEARGEVEELRLLQHFIAVCQTVAYAHSRGVIHRDLKPENVMVGPYGETLLLDWGIAKVLGRPEAAAPAEGAEFVELKGDVVDTGTQAGAIMGSPSYMAPEVAAGLNDQVDQVSDVYLLGATLYEILTGTLPRHADTVLELLRKAQHAPPTPPRQVNPRVARPLEAVCLKAMASAKADRYQTALEVAEEVQHYLAGEPVRAYPEPFFDRAKRWAKRHRKALTRIGVALLFAGLVTAGGVTLYKFDKERRQAARDADELRRNEQAAADLKEFRRLAEEAQFYAATTDSMSDNTPYFDPKKGEETGRAALAVLDKWGPALESFPLTDERPHVKQELADLLLLMAQVKGARAAEPAAARETLALLERAALVSEPSRSSYRLGAQAHRALGDAAKADEEQRRADDPATADTALDHFLQGERYRQETVKEASAQTEKEVWELNRSRRAKAVEEYRKALALDPRHFWARFQVGRCSLQLKQPAEAVEALTYCVALRPASPWGYTVRGLVLGALGRYAEAEDDLNRAVGLAPDLRLARLNRGVVRHMQKNDDGALADFDAVLAPPDEKRLIEAAYYRGELYLQRGEADKALADFDLVVRLRPDLRHVYTDRAQIYLARGDDAKALDDLNTYLSLGGPFDPKIAAGHAARGRLLRYVEMAPALRDRRVALGLADLDAAIKLGARSAGVFEDLGVMLEESGKVEAAVAAYTKGLELQPNDVLLLVKRAWVWDALGQRARAVADFQAALRADPKKAEAHAGLGYERATAKAAVEAQQEADLALLHAPDLPPKQHYLLLHNVACIYGTLSAVDLPRAAAHQDVAIALLRRAVELWKQTPGGPDEAKQIEDEPAFPTPLRQRPEFKALLRADER